MHPIDNDIKSGEYKSIYLLYGDEAFLRRTYKNKLIKALVNEGDTMNYTVFNSEKIEIKSLVELANTMPLFAEHRVIVCDNLKLFSKSNEDLAEYLKNPNDTTVLIFTEESIDKRTNVYKAAKSKGQLIECVLPKDKDQAEKEIATWIGSRLKAEGKKIQKEAWQEFYNRTCESMDMMDTEFNKLLSYVGDNETVTLEDVRTICSGFVEDKIFDMINALSAKNVEGVMNCYHSLLEAREEPIKILSITRTQFHKILVAKNMANLRYSKKDIAAGSGINIYFVDKTLNLARSFTEEELMGFIEQINELDQKMKSTLTKTEQKTAAIEVFLLNQIK
ncbi:MAG: DNA polymerase III subunit delta [Lachnospiraceae bacterium]|nr:DNA polymerase III subunit delta [Lachnospiraceae bacterium]